MFWMSFRLQLWVILILLTLSLTLCLIPKLQTIEMNKDEQETYKSRECIHFKPQAEINFLAEIDFGKFTRNWFESICKLKNLYSLIPLLLNINFVVNSYSIRVHFESFINSRLILK